MFNTFPLITLHFDLLYSDWLVWNNIQGFIHVERSIDSAERIEESRNYDIDN